MTTDGKMTRAEMEAKADELLADAFVTTQEIMLDKTAPATSRSSAVGSALSIYKDLRGEGGLDDKDLSEMTLEELDRKRRALEKLRLDESDDTDE